MTLNLGYVVNAVLPALLISPFIGSFLGVLIVRLPAGGAVGWSRSACEACGHRLGPADLVPIASYLVRRGRCRHCGAPIRPFHLWVELAAVAVAASAAGFDAAPATLAIDCGLGWTLLVLGWIDARHFWLPDRLTLPLVVAGLAEAAYRAPDTLLDRALGAILGYAAFRLLALVYRRWRGRDGLGEGDAKLLAAGGAWVGAAMLGDVVLVAALAGLLWALALKLRGRALRATTAIPFGPALALGIWLVRLYAAGLA